MLRLGLAGTGKAHMAGAHRRVQRRPHLQRRRDIEGVDQSREVLHHRRHRIGLDRVAQVDLLRQAST